MTRPGRSTPWARFRLFLYKVTPQPFPKYEVVIKHKAPKSKQNAEFICIQKNVRSK